MFNGDRMIWGGWFLVGMMMMCMVRDDGWWVVFGGREPAKLTVSFSRPNQFNKPQRREPQLIDFKHHHHQQQQQPCNKKRGSEN